MKRNTMYLLGILVLVGVAFLVIPGSPFAVVLPGGHLGSVTAGREVNFNVDVQLFAGSLEVENGKLWAFMKTMDETSTIWSEYLPLEISPAETRTFTFTVDGSTTRLWLPGEYKLIIEGRATDGSLLPLEGSLGDPDYTTEGGVSWQFRVLEAGVIPDETDSGVIMGLVLAFLIVALISLLIYVKYRR